MNLKNYCIVIMGETNNAVPQVEKVSDSELNILDAQGIMIITFSSFMEIIELNAWFDSNNNNFLLFELNPESCGYNIRNKENHNILFGFLIKNTPEKIKRRTDKLMENILEKKVNIHTEKIIRDNLRFREEIRDNTKKLNVEYTYEHAVAFVKAMTPIQREEYMNKIIDKGINDMTDNEKKILPLLAKD